MAFLHIGWSLLNIALVIGLFYSSYRNFVVFTNRYGYLPSGILFLLTVSMCQSSNKPTANQETKNLFQQTVRLPNTSINGYRSGNAKLIDLPTFSLIQSVIMSPKGQSDSVHVSSSVGLNGFVAGVYWLPIYTTATIQSKDRIAYSTSGVFEWRLLGFPVYRQAEHFEGSLTLTEPRFQGTD
ncbi:hypothetical protein GCM10027341_21520 [Spirosoma knui]